MVMKTTIPTRAISTTMMTDEWVRMSMSAFLYQPERKLMRTATASNTPRGRPMDTLRRNCFLFFRCTSQYCKKSSSFLFSISAHLKQKKKTYVFSFAFVWRYRADSNRCTRFCRPLPSHSATVPWFSSKISALFSLCNENFNFPIKISLAIAYSRAAAKIGIFGFICTNFAS